MAGMELLTTKLKGLTLRNREVYLDNDFLSFLFNDEDALAAALSFFAGSTLIVDRITAFEFLRDMYVPEEMNSRQQFLTGPAFNTPTDSSLHDSALHDNALLLSRIYAHSRTGGGKSNYSMADLFLAARAMLHAGSALTVTGNTKDFPPCIFDLVAAFNWRQKGDGTVCVFSVLRFNREKFETRQNLLDQVGQPTKD
ncbi:MAG: hypothetical protein U9Q03_00855 [Patescibacteria group bacterium]|nr:hypothetical protein [Patescibacteria group bacterium]